MELTDLCASDTQRLSDIQLLLLLLLGVVAGQVVGGLVGTAHFGLGLSRTSALGPEHQACLDSRISVLVSSSR